MLQARPVVLVLLGRQRLVVRLELVHLDAKRRSRASVAMMLAQVDGALAEAEAHVERRSRLEAMLEVDLEAEVTDVELAGLVFVEHAEDGRRRVETHGENVP